MIKYDQIWSYTITYKITYNHKGSYMIKDIQICPTMIIYDHVESWSGLAKPGLAWPSLASPEPGKPG